MRKVFKKITIAVIILATLVGCSAMKFNQETSKSSLLTERYTVARIEELKDIAEAGDMTFTKFKLDFDVQCVRKTHQGYYVVLLLEDDRNAFAFFDENDVLIRVIISNGFKSKDEFQKQVAEQLPKSKVLGFDANTIIAPVSAMEITAHIVQEGICIVKYLRFEDGKVVEDPIVASISFIENESIVTSEDPFIRDEVPFILEIDKADK